MPSKVIFTADQELDIIHCYRDGQSGVALASKYNCSEHIIYGVLRCNHEFVRTRSEAAKLRSDLSGDDYKGVFLPSPEEIAQQTADIRASRDE